MVVNQKHEQISRNMWKLGGLLAKLVLFFLLALLTWPPHGDGLHQKQIVTYERVSPSADTTNRRYHKDIIRSNDIPTRLALWLPAETQQQILKRALTVGRYTEPALANLANAQWSLDAMERLLRCCLAKNVTIGAIGSYQWHQRARIRVPLTATVQVGLLCMCSLLWDPWLHAYMSGIPCQHAAADYMPNAIKFQCMA